MNTALWIIGLLILLLGAVLGACALCNVDMSDQNPPGFLFGLLGGLLGFLLTVVWLVLWLIKAFR